MDIKALEYMDSENDRAPGWLPPRYNYSFLTGGYNVQMLINRSVGNSNTGSKRWVKKLISTDEESFYKNVEILSQIKSDANIEGLRIYSTVNSRNIIGAGRRFATKQFELLLNDESQVLMMYKDMHNAFISELMKPHNKETKYFLLDIDHRSRRYLTKVLQYLNDSCILFKFFYPTPNGFHVITEPFNPAYLKHLDVEVDLKKDALWLVES